MQLSHDSSYMKGYLSEHKSGINGVRILDLGAKHSLKNIS